MSDALDAVRLAVEVLDEHERRCRAASVQLPVELRTLRAFLSATARQGPPALDGAIVDDHLLTMSFAEAARRLSVSLRTVERLTAAGVIRVVRVGGAPRITYEDIKAYVDQLRLVTP